MSQALNSSQLRFDFGKAPVENQRQMPKGCAACLRLGFVLPAAIQTIIHLAKAVFRAIKTKHFCDTTYWKAQAFHIARVWQEEFGFAYAFFNSAKGHGHVLQAQYHKKVYEDFLKAYTSPVPPSPQRDRLTLPRPISYTEPQKVTAVAQDNRNARYEIEKQEINARAEIQVAEVGAYSSLSREFLNAPAPLAVKEVDEKQQRYVRVAANVNQAFVNDVSHVIRSPQYQPVIKQIEAALVKERPK